MQLTIDGLSMYYEQHGAGEDVLLLHGWGGDAKSFAPLVRDLSKKKRVTVIEFLGHGQSDLPPKPWNVTLYAAYLAKCMKALELGPCDVVAHSFGGRVAILLASTQGELIKRLVLTGAAGILPKRSALYHIKTRMYKFGKWLLQSKFMALLLGHERAQRILANTRLKAGSEDYRALSEEMKQTFVLVVNQDLQPHLKDIKAPTLLLWGDQDTQTPLWMGKVMEKEIPNAGLVVLPGSHFMYLEQYPKFLAIVSNFLS